LPSALGTGEYVYLTISSGALTEIIKVDNNTGAPAYTGCSRGQQGTTALSWTSGAKVECRVTKSSVDTKQESLDTAAPTAVTPQVTDNLLIKDDSDSNKLKQVLVSDLITLAAASAGGDFVKISSKTASASTVLDFTDLGDYSEIRFVITNLVLSAGYSAGLFVRTSTDNGSTFASSSSNYSYTVYAIKLNTGQISSSNSDSTNICLVTQDTGFGFHTQTGNAIGGELVLFDPADTTSYKQFTYNLSYISAGDDYNCRAYGGGTRLATASIDAVRFYVGTGNITSGKIYAYGVKK
jgi:hypothetical protein